MIDIISWRVLRRGGRMVLSRQGRVRVEGIEHVPASGPVMIAARHYHHLLDGCALITAIDRPLHVVVGLDWIEGAMARRAMDALCRTARWPIVLRPDDARVTANTPRRTDVERDRDRRVALRMSARDVTSLLAEGRVVVVFPEGYPNIDPSFTPKTGDAFLPFQPGFVRYARIAGRSGAGTVPIVPAGFAYERDAGSARWRVTLRFGRAIDLRAGAPDSDIVDEVERAVRTLSRPA